MYNCIECFKSYRSLKHFVDKKHTGYCIYGSEQLIADFYLKGKLYDCYNHFIIEPSEFHKESLKILIDLWQMLKENKKQQKIDNYFYNSFKKG